MRTWTPERSKTIKNTKFYYKNVKYKKTLLKLPTMSAEQKLWLCLKLQSNHLGLPLRRGGTHRGRRMLPSQSQVGGDVLHSDSPCVPVYEVAPVSRRQSEKRTRTPGKWRGLFHVCPRSLHAHMNVYSKNLPCAPASASFPSRPARTFSGRPRPASAE